MPLTEDGYVIETDDELRKDFFTNFENYVDNPKKDESSFWYALFQAVGETLEEHQEVSIQDVYQAGFLATATDGDLTKKAAELGVDRREARPATGVITFLRNESATTDYLIQEGTVVRTSGDDPVRFETTEAVTLASGTTEVDANIRALQGGTEGNVAADTIQTMPSPPEGVDACNNRNPVGNPDYTDTAGDPLIRGLERESDSELRQRTFETTSIGGAATANAIDSALRDLGVESVTVRTNPNSTEDSDGMSPYSSEVITNQGDVADSEVAETIYETVSVTDLFRLENGIHGNAASYSIQSDVLDQSVSVKWSTPTEVTLDITVDLTHDDEYVGDGAVKDAIVSYVGGTSLSGETIVGTNTAEEVYIDKIKSNITESATNDNGVIGISNLVIDTDGDGTDDRTTDSNGLEVIDIADTEIATIPDPTNDITVNSTKMS